MYYLIILLVYAAVDVIACLGLSLQFGVAGVTNFGFMIFQAIGAYVAAALALPPDTANGGFQTYVGGFSLPFPLPWIGAAAAGGLLALPFMFLVGRRLRGDFAAVGLLVTAVLLNLLATNYRPLFNGDAGVAVVPTPLAPGMFVATSAVYQYAFAAGGVVLAGVGTGSSGGSPSRRTGARCAPCATTTRWPTRSARTCSRSALVPWSSAVRSPAYPATSWSASSAPGRRRNGATRRPSCCSPR